MKRLLYLLMALSYTFFSCSDNENDIGNPDDPDNPSSVSLKISTTDLVFMSEKGEKEFTITCNSDCAITNESLWCRTDVTKRNGDKTVTVTVNAYSETEDRNTNLTIKAGDKTEILTVTQKYGDAIILSKSKFDMNQEGGNITIPIESNIDYTVTIPAVFRSWIQQASESRTVETKNFCFTISANEDENSREGARNSGQNNVLKTLNNKYSPSKT